MEFLDSDHLESLKYELEEFIDLLVENRETGVIKAAFRLGKLIKRLEFTITCLRELENEVEKESENASSKG